MGNKSGRISFVEEEELWNPKGVIRMNSVNSLTSNDSVALPTDTVTPIKAKFYDDTIVPTKTYKDQKTLNGITDRNGFNNNGIVKTNGHVHHLRPLLHKRVEELIAEQYVDTFEPEHQNGPDYIIPAENIYTSQVNGAVKLKVTSNGPASKKPISVVTLLKKTVENYPEHFAMAVKRKGEWIKWTYNDYWNDTKKVAKGFMKLGLEPFHGVGILGFNAPEWYLAYMGAICAGGLATGIYTTNSPEACFHVLNDCQTNIVIVENDIQMKKIDAIRHKLPHLKAVIQYIGEPTSPGALSWSELLSIGESMPDSVVEKRIKGLSVNQCSTLIYTSGTTGNPKGVMLSHDNLTSITQTLIDEFKMKMGEEIYLSYLPLSHVAAQVTDMFLGLGAAGEVYFAQPDALKGSLVETLREVKPTRILGVPRIWEKIAEKMQEAEKSMSTVKKMMMQWARGIAFRYNTNKMSGSSSVPLGYPVANKLVLNKVRQALGFDRTVQFCTGAAPITREVLDFFTSINMVLSEGFGMSESTGPHTVNRGDLFRLGSVGTVLPGLEIRIDNPDAGGNGELCLRGRNTFMGYLGIADKTEECYDKEGWLHSGDVAVVDTEGFVYITGRIKELLITAGGENVAPVPIEDAVKKYLPIVSNCMLIGDKRKFLSILLTLKTDIDTNTLLPLDSLTSPAKDWCRSIGSNANTVHDILSGPDNKVMEAIQQGIDRANKEAVSNAQRIQKWVVLPRDFSIPGGELGPTLKLKRPAVTQNYQETIDDIYEGC